MLISEVPLVSRQFVQCLKYNIMLAFCLTIVIRPNRKAPVISIGAFLRTGLS